MTLVATQVKRRRGTTAENDAFTGAEGEITVDLTTHELRVHDGSTVGGHTIPTKNYGYSKTENDNLLSNKANVALDNLTPAGKEVCANMSMPSATGIDLTVGASGSTYKAPADGWFVAIGSGTGTNMWLELKSDIAQGVYGTIGWQYKVSLAVKKGASCELSYNNINFATFRFVYAQGAQ